MSTWNLGIDDVSEETRYFKDKLASKDGHIAAQQDKIVKQAAELDELKNRLNEALQKLGDETKRALQLETDLKQRTEDLRNEKLASDNVKAALHAAQEKTRSTNLEMRQLESTLERISHTSDEHNSRGARLEREKSILEARVKELEAHLQQLQLTQLQPTTTPGRRAARPRSSSLSNLRITTLEQDLLEVRGALAKKETDLQAVNQKLTQVQRDLIQSENEKVALEKKWNSQLEAIQASLDDKEEELRYLREQQGDGSREEELLRRIEEDDAKIAALEMMLRGQEDSTVLKEKLRRADAQVKDLQRRLREDEEHRVELVREKEEAFEELDRVRREVQDLAQELESKKALEQAVKDKATKSLETCDDPLMNDDSCLIDMDALEPAAPAQQPQVSQHMMEVDVNAIDQIEKLLHAVDRLRGERDALRRDVQFLESESRFTIEALEAKLLSVSTSPPSSNQTMATMDQLKAEMDEMHAQLVSSRERHETVIHSKNLQIRRLGIQVQGLTVALQHTDSQAIQSELGELMKRYDETVVALEAVSSHRDELLQQLKNKEVDWEKYVEDVFQAEQDALERFEDAKRDVAQLKNQLEEVIHQRDDFFTQLQNKDADWEKYTEEIRSAEQDARRQLEDATRDVAELDKRLRDMTDERDDLLNRLQEKGIEGVSFDGVIAPLKSPGRESRERLEEAMREIAELNAQLEEIESERDSLALQVTNLTADLQIAQDELANAESRYTNLQFHQLSNMSSSEATRTLREHIEELEGRVNRRNELVGILQHDVRRLDTNLRLQEERMVEMTTELETLAAQKDAMVEDCADAREARDAALGRVENLEEELENMESRHSEDQKVVKSLITVVADTVSRARDAIRQIRDQATGAKNELSASQQERQAIQQELDEKIASLLEMTKQSTEHRDELEKVRQALTQCQAEAKDLSSLAHTLQEEKARLQSQLAAFENSNNDAIISELQTKNKELEDRLQETVERLSASGDDSERNIVQLKLQHTEALGALQGRLLETESALEELQSRFKSAADEHLRAQEDANKSLRDLQQQLDSAKNALSALEEVRDQFNDSEKENVARLAELEEQLAKASQDHQDTLAACEALRAENAQLIVDLERLQEEQENLRQSENDKVAIKSDLERKVNLLQGRLEEENRLLEISREEVRRLDLRIQEEVEGRARDRKAHAVALSSANEERESALATAAKLEGDLIEIQKKLDESEALLATAEEEKINLQQEITTLEAEIQKSKSLDRYLEGQIKDNENLVVSLKAEIEHLKSELAHSEKAWKAAEVNLSLQNAQHKRETAELQKELAALRKRPNLETALAELEERNNEMEELLRAKCAEIEENDDRVLEMLKEKKKLTAKVESLNRKVQNLQAKLAAAKAANPTGTSSESKSHSPKTLAPPPAPPSAIIATQTQSQTPQAIIVPVSRPRSATVTSAPPSARSPSDTPQEVKRKSSASVRIVSGPSSLPRPKTPERSRALAPVFKSQTPEKRLTESRTHAITESGPLPSAVVIGKKRAAPDDFEACENIPAQAFTADGEDVENKTPRVRRMLNSLQSGFTPVRHQSNQSARPTIPMPSPRRSAAPTRTSPHYISDLTNSPYQNIPSMPAPPSSTKPSNKRSWLGKIRGTSQSAEKSSVKNLFDRGESS